jgi:galactokinase
VSDLPRKSGFAPSTSLQAACRQALARAIDAKPQSQREHVRIAHNGPPSRAGKW